VHYLEDALKLAHPPAERAHLGPERRAKLHEADLAAFSSPGKLGKAAMEVLVKLIQHIHLTEKELDKHIMVPSPQPY
jgi:hypothetical protein